MNTYTALNRHNPFRKIRIARSAIILPTALLFVGSALLSAGSVFAEDSNRGISKRHEKNYDHDRYQRRGQHDERDRYSDRNRHNDRNRYNDRRRYDSRGRYDGHDRYDQYNRYDRNHQYDRNHDRRRYEYDRHARPGYYPTDRYDSHRRNFDIPKVIAHSHRHRYKDYYNTRVYYKDHRHNHDIYRFPVYVEGQLTYRPYAYCEGNYFATGYFTIDGPRFSIRLGF